MGVTDPYLFFLREAALLAGYREHPFVFSVMYLCLTCQHSEERMISPEQACEMVIHRLTNNDWDLLEKKCVVCHGSMVSTYLSCNDTGTASECRKTIAAIKTI